MPSLKRYLLSLSILLGKLDINLADFGEEEPKQFKGLLSDS
jgi:hypothetical protein